METCEIAGDQEGPTYANVKQIKRKSQTHREESSTQEDGTTKQTQSADEHCTPLMRSTPNTTDNFQAHGAADVNTVEKQENKDYVYAIVHKDNKGRDPAVSDHARTPCSKRLQVVNHSQEALVGDEKIDYLYGKQEKEATSGKYNGDAFLVICAFSVLLFKIFFGDIDQRLLLS